MFEGKRNCYPFDRRMGESRDGTDVWGAELTLVQEIEPDYSADLPVH